MKRLQWLLRPVIEGFLAAILEAVCQATPTELASLLREQEVGTRRGPQTPMPNASAAVAQEIVDPAALLGASLGVDPAPAARGVTPPRRRALAAPRRRQGPLAAAPARSEPATVSVASVRAGETLVRAGDAGLVLRRRRHPGPASEPATPATIAAAVSAPGEDGAPPESSKVPVFPVVTGT